MEFDEEQLARCLNDACQNSTILSDLLQAERPDVTWTDRAALDELIEQLEIAATARRIEQLRVRLLELAEELDAGRVKHRVEARSAHLNKLRLNAVNELRQEAATVEQAKELPGPSAGAWIAWACDLQDDKDGEILSALRSDFAALERFTSEMDPSYWMPRHAEQGSAAPSPARAKTPAATADFVAASPIATSSANGEKLPDSVKSKFERAKESDSYADALALCYDRPSETETAPQTSWHEEAGPAKRGVAFDSDRPFGQSKPETEPLKRCDECGTFFPGELYICPFDNSFLRTIADGDVLAVHPSDKAGNNGSGKKDHFQSGIGPGSASGTGVAPESPKNGDTTRDPAEVEFERLKSLLEQLPPPAPAEIKEAEIEEEEEQKVPVPKRRIYEWVGAGSLVLLVIVVLIYYFYGTSHAEPSRTVAAANSVTAAPAPKPPDTTTASPDGLLNKQPLEGAQDKIMVSLEECERSKPESIDCWGYVSNLGNPASNLVINRVDVVDGKGNSSSLYGNSQTSFPSGHRFSVPTGSRAKFALKMPDKDKEVHSLTMYVDLSAPRNLEYTFRDIPVKE